MSKEKNAERKTAIAQKGGGKAPTARVQEAEGLGFSALAFRRRLSAWYRESARALPWRGVGDPYATWLSEIMLQQTRVATVIDRYQEFLLRFPTIHDLAAAEEEDVLALWSGLGYYRRARMLYRGAQFVDREFGGKLPRSAAKLRTLPGVGEYTAAAIASIAFGESVAVLDGNVERVLLRVLGRTEQKGAKARAQLAEAAQALMPAASRKSSGENAAGDHNQAMMELGATNLFATGSAVRAVSCHRTVQDTWGARDWSARKDAEPNGGASVGAPQTRSCDGGFAGATDGGRIANGGNAGAAGAASGSNTGA